MSKKCGNIFVTGGGTGGHIYPALAVADELSKDNINVYYAGCKTNMEFELAKSKGYRFLHVNISAMPRGLNPKILIWGIKLLSAVIHSVSYIKKYKPFAVFATGGYVSAPMIFACMITKTPYIMHDCDAMPGLVTRNLSGQARYVTLAFEGAKKYIQNKNTVITGNPIRKEFKLMTESQARLNFGLDKNKVTLCIMGGSQGAQSINNTAAELLREFSQDLNLKIFFQTGRKNYKDVMDRLKKVYPDYARDKNLDIRPYFDDMISVLKSSDIVVSRAGSLSLSEICASNAAAVLVPFPYAAANHQRINAKYLLRAGACIYIEDDELEPNLLKKNIIELLSSKVKMDYLKQNSMSFAKYDAAEQIAGLLKNI